MSKQQFLENVELERRLLAEGVPVASLIASEDTYTFEPDGGSAHFHVKFFDVSGGHAADLLRRRLTALFFGTAWKVLDMAVELALTRAGQEVEFQATKKLLALQSSQAQLAELPSVIWGALTTLYAETMEIRHALVHRRAQIVNGTLIGSPRVVGKTVPPISHSQQVRFCELIQRMCDSIDRGFMTIREQHQCQYLLWELRDLHGNTAIQRADRSSIVRVAFVLPESRQIPVAAIKSRMDGWRPGWTGIDLELTDPKSELKFVGELEHFAEDFITVNPQQPPDWLKQQVLPSGASGPADSE